MSGTTTRMPLKDAQVLADEVVRMLKRACVQITIAGSIRRQKPTVGDIEVVCVPRLVTVMGGLFGDQPETVDALEARVADLMDDLLEYRLDRNLRKAAGSRYRRLFYQGFPLDLFSPAADSYGAILTIRTGPAEYSHRLVTPRSQGGLMPDHLQMKEGSLRYRVSGEAIPTPTEESFFAAISLPWIAPEDRQ